MHPILKLAAGLVAGAAAFVLVAIGVTSLFGPQIEFSLFVGLPVGLWAGIATATLVAVGLWYRDAAAEATLEPWLVRSLWAAVAVAVDVVVVFALGTAWYYLLDGGADALGLLIFGIPVTMVAAAVVGYFAARSAGGRGRTGRDDGPAAQ